MPEEEINIGPSAADTEFKPGPAPANTSAPAADPQSVLDAMLQLPDDAFIPWEQCQLPSLGYYYDGWSDGVIQVRAMTQQCEKILATERLARSGQSIEFVFAECCRMPNNFNPVDLLIGDKIFLLYYLRGITYGNKYEFMVTCPKAECGHQSQQEYDLNELVSTLTPAKAELGKEPFKITLPYLSEMSNQRGLGDFWVEVRFLRSADIYSISTKRKVKKSAMPGNMRQRMDQRAADRMSIDDSITENLEKVIVSAMGDRDPMKIRRMIGRLHSRDSATIREWLKVNTPGIDATIKLTCPECEGEFVMELPITESFFRPTNK